MKSSWRILHPATMFFLLTLFVVLLSWICSVYGIEVIHPQTGEAIQVQSLISPEGVRWILRNVIVNFTGFAPLGLVIVAMFGLGVAEHSGFITACIRCRVKKARNKRGVILLVIALGLLFNIVGDAGYIILLPIAAALFYSVNLHPVGGIITAYVSVSCGYSANIILSTLDQMISSTTQDAAIAAGIYQSNTGPLSNYYFMFVSAFLIAAIIYQITVRSLLPGLGMYKGESRFEEYKPLSRREKRAVTIALLVGLLYFIVIFWATFSSWGLLRSVNGGLIRSPFIVGILFILSLAAGIMGMVYGFSSKRYRTDTDVVEGLAQPMKILGVYFVIAFFAAQMFACMEYTRLDKCLAIMGADLLSSVQIGRVWVLLLFIMFTAFINLFMVSATAKWSFMAFIFVPVFAELGVSPDVTQCAFRIGDSATNAITPFMFYMPLVLTYMQQYDRHSTYVSLLKYTWKYAVYVLMIWTLLFTVWYLTGLPLGL